MLLQNYILLPVFFHFVFSLPKDVHQKFNPSLYQGLKAARSYGSILSRSDRISIVRDVVLTYADEHNERTKFASRVKLSGNRPTLVLEEFDHLLNFVDCADSTLSFGFRDSLSYSHSKDACSDLDQGLIVASHASCSESGAHSVYEITKLRFDDESKRLIFETQPSSFRDAFKSHKVDFGRTSEPHYFHRHERLARRQSPTSTLSQIPESVAAGAIPTQTYDIDTVTLDLTQEAIDTTFELPLGVEVAPAFPISIGCKECTTTGSLILSAGEIDLSNPIELGIQFLDPDQEMDFIQAGYFEAELNGFEASILLSATPSGNVEFAYDLFTFAPAGFNIPGFGSVGVIFQPQIAFDIDISGGIEFTWGFKVTVPDQSRIHIDIAEFSNSSVTGIGNTTIGALPFNANASDIELSLSVGLRPFIALGMSFFDGDLQLLGGPYIDLPFIKATMTQLASSNVNENCETGSGQTNSEFSQAFQNLTQITGEIGIGVGFELEAVIDPPGFDPSSLVRSWEGWNTTISLPTACLAFTEESGFAVARDVLEDMNNASDGGSGGGKSAANSLDNPFGAKVSLLLGLSLLTGFFTMF